MAYKVKKVPASTNNITTGVVNFLLEKGHSASRVNVMGIFDAEAMKFRKSGSRNGFYDIACTLKTRFQAANGKFIGVTLMIDTKRGRDKLSDDQKEFKAEIEAAGGITFETKTYSDFLTFYEHIIKPNYL